MDYQNILFEVSDGVGRITLNRPDAANGMDLAMMQELHHAATICDQDDAVRAVLITGAGKMFSAGGDLKSFLSAGDNLGAMLTQMTTFFHGTVSLLNRMDAPVVTAINGTAAGGGLSFGISGDIVLAAESAKFTLAYTAAGLSPDGSSSYFLPRLVGMRRAKELLLTNRVLTAAEADAYGMVDRVVPDGELMAEAEKLARGFATGPTHAYGAVKRLLSGTFSESLETQMELEARTINALVQSPDGREGVAAFAEKRKPDFIGK
ncbi:MAG: enoyl-CoA hydratase [Minwuiales bacterium]|nr:enoyl-CoA hydratase [Minwuiales bacterium]